MSNKVLKKDELLEKINWQRKTYPLKLSPTDVQWVNLNNLIFEYKKCINAAIDIILNKVFKEFELLSENEWEGKKCPLCKAESKKLTYLLKNFEVVNYKVGKKISTKPIYREGAKTKVCNCFLGQSSTPHKIMRKFVLPSSNRSILPKNDFTVYGKLTIKNLEKGEGKRPSIYDSCLQKAMETIKSQIKINEKIDNRIKYLSERVNHNNDFLKGKVKDKDLKKYSKETIKRFIKRDKTMIIKLKNRKAHKIEYKQNSIRLYENSYHLIKEKDDFIIKLKDYRKGEIMLIEFLGNKYQKKLANKFIEGEKCETELLKKGNDFYLQYIYKEAVEISEPDQSFTAVGINTGLNNLSTSVSMDKDLKVKGVSFYSGKKIKSKRKRMANVRAIWGRKTKSKKSGGKGRSRKWFKDKCKNQAENKYIKYQIHKLTTKIVQDIRDKHEKPVIILKNLTHIRDTKFKIPKHALEGIKNKQRIKEYRKIITEINRWNFADFQKFIEYKANWMGIPIVYVRVKNKCSKCGYDQKADGLNFKCKKCGYDINSDFNDAVNIAKSYFDDFKNDK